VRHAAGESLRAYIRWCCKPNKILLKLIEQVRQQIGAVILPRSGIITSINEQIKSFSKLSEGTKTTIVVVAALAAVVGPLVLLLVLLLL
jgi:predicted class III extradiol MEMO1 family dioxygenase